MRALRRLQILLLSGLIQLSTAGAAQAAENAIADSRLQTALSKLEELAQKEVASKTVVALAIGVVYKDKLIYAKGFGPRELGKDPQVDADTVFQIASCSKPVSATVVAELVGEGKITWDSKICDLDPGFQLFNSYPSNELTIRDLYAHRSGLPEHAGDLLEDMGYDRNQVLHQLRYQLPESSFRSHYAYTNFGMTEGAVAATKPYGLTFEEAATEKLFKPLGMNSTSARYADFIANPNHASDHTKVDGVLVHTSNRQPDAQSPAGGVSSSVNDMARWIRLRLGNGKFEGKQIVAEKPLVETTHPHMLTSMSPLSGLPCFYGLGFNVNYDEDSRLHLSHSGAFAMGVASNVTLVPSEQIGIVILSNSYPVGVPEGLAAAFMDYAIHGEQKRDWLSLYKQLFENPATLGLDSGFDYKKVPSKPSAPLTNAAYVGTYTNDLFGNISVIEKDGKLAVVQGPKNMTFPMTHYDRDTFTYVPPGENSPGASGLTFNVGPSGKALSVVAENLNAVNQGTFTRVDKK